MSPQNKYADQYTALAELLRSWDRRRRQQQTVAWLARSLMPGLLLGVILALLSRVFPLFENGQIALLSLIALLLGAAALVGVVWLWPRSPLDAARGFDQTFGLQERVSTALELLEGRIRAADVLVLRQVEDAYAQAHSIRAEALLPLSVRRMDWAAVAVLGLLLSILLIIPNEITRAGPDSVEQQNIAAAADDVREVIEDVAADTSLDEDERSDLLETLQTNLETLQDEDVSLDEALAVLSDIEALMERQAADGRERAEAQQSGLQSALEALGEPDEASFQDDAGVGERAGARLDELAEALESLDDMERGDLADSLERAADSLEDSSPDAAESLRDAADSLRRGETQEAADSMRDAGEQMEQSQSQQERDQQQSQRFEEQRDRLQARQQELLGEDADDAPGEDGESIEPSDAGEGDDANGDGEPSEGAQMAPDDGQDGDEDAPAAVTDSDEADAEGEGGAGDPDEGGDPSGDEDGSPSAQIGDQPGSFQDDGAMFPEMEDAPEGEGGEGGEREYEPVFAPRPPNIDTDGPVIELQPDASDAPLIEGDFGPNPFGEAVVPYNQVFGNYAEAANQALNRGYIPLGMRDIVRDYFTSLAPRTSSTP